VSALDREGRIIWMTDAHRDNGKRFVVHADEKLTAFLKLDQRDMSGNSSFFIAGRELVLEH